MGVLLESAAWLSHAVCSALYLMFAAGVVVRNPRAPLNRMCGLLMLTFAFWSACLAVSHHPHVTRATAQRFYDLGSLSWGTFASQALLFAAMFAKKPWLRAPWFWGALIVPAAATVYAQNTGLLAADYLERPWGWSFVWAENAAVKLFLLYYGSRKRRETAADWRRASAGSRRRTRSKPDNTPLTLDACRCINPCMALFLSLVTS